MKIYFAVNKDGTEICSNDIIHRKIDLVIEWNKITVKRAIINKDPILPSDLFDETTDEYCYWTNESTRYDIDIYDGVSAYNTVTFLPKGSIKKILGYELSWEDNYKVVNI